MDAIQQFEIKQTAVMMNEYAVILDGALFATFKGKPATWSGTWTVDGREFKVTSDSALTNQSHLETAEGVRIADCVKNSTFGTNFSVTCYGHEYKITMKSGTAIHFLVHEGDRLMAEGAATSYKSSNGHGYLATEIPFEGKLALLYFFARGFRR